MVFCQEHQFLWNIVSVCLPMWGRRFTERFSITNLGYFLTNLPILLQRFTNPHSYFWKFFHTKIKICCLASMKIVGNTVYMPTCVYVEAEKFNFATQELSLPYIFMNFAFIRCKDKRRKYPFFLFTVPFSFLIEWVLFSYRESCFWNASLLMMIDSK